MFPSAIDPNPPGQRKPGYFSFGNHGAYSFIEQAKMESDIKKAHCDHVSILAYFPLGNGSYEYFLCLLEPSFVYTLLGTRVLGEAWKNTADRILQDAKLPLETEGILRLDRWFIPGTEKMFNHVVFAVAVNVVDLKHEFTKVFSGAWLTSTQLIQFQQTSRLFSPEIADIILNACVSCAPGMQMVRGNEITRQNLFIDINSNKIKRLPHEIIVHAAQLSLQDQELLYKEFLSYTAPYLTMGLNSFGSFMMKLGWAQDKLTSLFHAFDLQNQGGLTFRDFLVGLAAVDQIVPHGGPPAEIRCRYIFRYYDKNGDGKLDFEEFKSLVADIRRVKGLAETPHLITEEAEKSARLFGAQTKEYLSMKDFLTSVGQLKFRGTSNLLRSPIPVSTILNGLQQNSQPSVSTVIPQPTNSGVSSNNNTDGLKNAAEQYDIATHSIRIRKSGTVLDVHSLWNIEHSGISTGDEFQSSSLIFGENELRTLSSHRFNQDSQPNEMLNGLRYFEREIPKDHKSRYGPKPAFHWGEVDRTSLARSLITLCNQARKIIMNEPRLLEIPAPCYILGDLHGNFPDLMCFEKSLWRLGAVLTPASFLFLGDYVDRGAFGVEVCCYLFAHKILAPAKFHLLRGNHEIRSVQQMFTFLTECITKFGEKIGTEVWDAVNLLFDCMPLAAVVDKKIFCVHGGIPPPWIGDGYISIINSIPCPLPLPEEQSALAWELMWNDPLHLDQLTPTQIQQLGMLHGFGSNLRRGTAHVFNDEALEAFLTKNGLSHVVRAHEVQEAGFQVHHGGKLLTVFSSSKYCGGSNDAACILADKCKLRTLRIDTS